MAPVAGVTLTQRVKLDNGILGMERRDRVDIPGVAGVLVRSQHHGRIV